MTESQRAAMQQALAFIQDIDRDDNDRDILTQSQCESLDSCRNALRYALAEPVQVPFAWMNPDTGSVASSHEVDAGYVLANAFPVPLYTSPQPPNSVPLLTEPFGYFRAEPFGWTDCAPTDEGARPLYEHPVNVPLLNRETIDNEIQKHVDPVATYGGLHNFARAIESLVREKAGIK